MTQDTEDVVARDAERAWLDYETGEPIPLDEGNNAYDKRVRMLKHAFRAGYMAARAALHQEGIAP